MALLSESDRQTVRGHLAAVTRPVKLLLFTQTIGAPETALIARQVLDEVASLNDHLSIEEVNVILDREKTNAFNVEHIPSVAILRGDDDTRMRFVGAPAGYEFMSLIEAIILAGTDDSGLSEESKTLIAEHVTGPMHIQVFVTPT